MADAHRRSGPLIRGDHTPGGRQRTAKRCQFHAVDFYADAIRLSQAVCQRFGLAIGYNTRAFVWCMMGVAFVISFPLGKLLDYLLGVHA